MFWMDLIMISLHNFSFLWFAVALLVGNTSYHDLGDVALLFSILEMVIIGSSYWILFRSDKVRYYTQFLLYQHGTIELSVNVPMMFLLNDYLFRTSNEGESVMLSFWVCAAMYFGYAIYSYWFNAVFWPKRNRLRYEMSRTRCLCIVGTIWTCAMFLFLVMAMVYVSNIDTGIEVAVILFALPGASFVLLPCLCVPITSWKSVEITSRGLR